MFFPDVVYQQAAGTPAVPFSDSGPTHQTMRVSIDHAQIDRRELRVWNF
jgi:hypothetical protein